MITMHRDTAALGCPTCRGFNIIKSGKSRQGRQRYLCKPCNRRFVNVGAMPYRRMPPEQVGAALSMFYGGMSVAETSRNLAPIFDISPPSKATIYEWVVDYTRLAKNLVSTHRFRTGDTWVADEMVLKIGGQNYWNWNVMDAKSRYILASHISKRRTTADAIQVFSKAAKLATKPPKVIVTDRLAAYIDGIERVFGADSRHVQSQGIRAAVNNNLSERLQGTIRQRTKTMRGMQRRDTAQLMMDGWNVYYNYFRPHESLGDRTPADALKIRWPVKNWEDVARMDVMPFSRMRGLRERRLKERGLQPREVFRRRKSAL